MGDFDIGGSKLDRLAECHRKTLVCEGLAADLGMTHLRTGGSRAVYALGPNRVVKVARGHELDPSWGRDANIREARIWRSAGSDLRSRLAPILDSHSRGDWLVMRRADSTRADASKLDLPGLDVDDVEAGIINGRRVAIDYAGISKAHGPGVNWTHERHR